MNHGTTKVIEPEDDSRWRLLISEEVDYALKNTPSNKAPDEDSITVTVLKMAWKNRLFKTRLFNLLQSCVKLGYPPRIWKDAIIMVIPKPNKPGYIKPRAYRPISLLKVTSKVLEKILQIRMTALRDNLLPPEQFGDRQGYSATDAVLDIVQKIETTKDTTLAILLDIQDAFDNVNSSILTDTMEQMNLPKNMIRWTYQYIRGRRANMSKDQRKGQDCDISTGIPQG